eukprot:TRINITY_DN18499_c0_g1_i1.p1 TRINITY_DN18499_c0_g1~~TRINITY_DN18499_c0_g1_i1.p1  ORF type:complete len:159 (-),score=19.79 TRINITY_DN18499_c0_g1_i1:39-515(-)
MLAAANRAELNPGDTRKASTQASEDQFDINAQSLTISCMWTASSDSRETKARCPAHCLCAASRTCRDRVPLRVSLVSCSAVEAEAKTLDAHAAKAPRGGAVRADASVPSSFSVLCPECSTNPGADIKKWILKDKFSNASLSKRESPMLMQFFQLCFGR